MAVNILEKFNQALDEVIQAWIKLSDEWEKIERTHSDKLSEKYPFDKDFCEVISDLIEWKEHIK
jgi:transcriptional regulatory protein LevR